MLSEEALILVGALVVVALLVLGVLEILWPTRPGRRRARPPAQGAQLRPAHGPVARLVAPPSPAPETHPRADRPAPTASAPTPSPPPFDTSPPSGADPDAEADDLPVFLQRERTSPQEPPVDRAETAGVDADADADADADLPVAERCARLLASARYADAAALAHAALAGAPGLAPADRAETARLWSLMARACWGRGEGEAARRAMESAIGVAPAEDVSAQRELVALVLDATPPLLRAADADAAPPSRLATLREALAWIDAAEAVGARDAAVANLGLEVQAALWPAWEQVVHGLLQRHDFRGARRLLREALGDPRLPHGSATAFRALLRRTFGGEVGQLTAQAVRGVQQGREADALGYLRRAERLLAALDEDALSPARREELGRRVWWSYTRLGTRRLEAGDCEAALEPLLQALRFESAGAGERPEARTTLVQALARVVEARAAAIRRHVHTGDRDAALEASRRLWRLLEAAGEHGLDEDALVEVKGTAQRVTRELDSAVSRRR